MIANHTHATALFNEIQKYTLIYYRTYVEANGISRNGRAAFSVCWVLLCVWRMHACRLNCWYDVECESGIASSIRCDGCAMCARSAELRESVHVPNKHLQRSINNDFNKHTFGQMTCTRKFLARAWIATRYHSPEVKCECACMWKKTTRNYCRFATNWCFSFQTNCYALCASTERQCGSA